MHIPRLEAGIRPSVAVLSALLLILSAASAANARLNVLLITADDLGLQLNCYGDHTVPTPNLDGLARQSVQFQTAYVAQASCSPSRSAMLTGVYPHANGHYGLANAGVGFRLHANLIPHSVPNVLKRHGYRTAVIGKLHVNPEPDLDFDYRNKTGFGGRLVRQQVEYARAFWDECGDQPWFLMFNVFDPHVNGKREQGAPAFPDVVDGIPTSIVGPRDVSAWPWQGVDTQATRKRIAGYYNCVQRVDAAIGMLMDSLEQTGMGERTIVVFLGDHGPPFSRGKTSCYESGLRVPFFLKWPGVSQPHVSQQLVSAVDIAPTIFDAAAVPIPEMVQGRSLRFVAVADTIEPWRKTLVGEFHYHGAGSFFPRRAITDGRYKLIHNMPGGGDAALVRVDGDPSSSELERLPQNHAAREIYARLQNPPPWELYDLQEDPHEWVNRSGEDSMQQVETRLKNALSAWQAKTDDRFNDLDYCADVQKQYRKP